MRKFLLPILFCSFLGFAQDETTHPRLVYTDLNSMTFEETAPLEFMHQSVNENGESIYLDPVTNVTTTKHADGTFSVIYPNGARVQYGEIQSGTMETFYDAFGYQVTRSEFPSSVGTPAKYLHEKLSERSLSRLIPPINYLGTTPVNLYLQENTYLVEQISIVDGHGFFRIHALGMVPGNTEPSYFTVNVLGSPITGELERSVSFNLKNATIMVYGEADGLSVRIPNEWVFHIDQWENVNLRGQYYTNPRMITNSRNLTSYLACVDDADDWATGALDDCWWWCWWPLCDYDACTAGVQAELDARLVQCYRDHMGPGTGILNPDIRVCL